ncbi:MAG: hypothetical protein QNJ42_10335 [Crocosphaera sp.]|nr:hypothetical protein [Crocosphaera sp.]
MDSHQNSSEVKQDLLTVKKAVKQEFRNIAGLEGFGIGDGVINVYVSNSEVCKKLPPTFHNVPLNVINTGIIEAL